MQDKRSWKLALLLMGILLASSLPQPVRAFNVIDHAMCKGVALPKAPAQPTCEQRTSEFLPTDELAYLWVRGSLEKSDVEAKPEFKFYDPDGGVFPTSFGVGEVTVAREGGEIATWMGIGVVRTNNTGGLVDFSGGSVKIRTGFGTLELRAGGSATWGTAVVPGQYAMASKLGEWRAEFTLDGKIVVSQRFTIGKTTTATPTIITTPTTATPTIITTAPRETTVTTPIARETQLGAPGLPSNMILIAAIAVLVAAALVAWRLLLRRGKVPMPPAVEAARPPPAPPPLAPEARIPVPPLAPAAVAPARRALESPVGAKYCIECGELIPEAALYCPRCASRQE